MKVAVIIPTYNEKENIISLCQEILSVLKNTEAHIVVVDDNSADGTGLQVTKLAKENSRVHLIVRKKKRGRGSAVIDGFRFAFEELGSEVFVEMDADFSHDPHELLTLLENVDSYTVVLASRYLKESSIIDWPLKRKIASMIGNILINTILQLGLKDNTNGYRAYPRNAVELLLDYDFVSNGYIVLSESAKLLVSHGFHYREVRCVFVNRKRGKSSTRFKEFYDSLKNLFKIKKHVATYKTH